MRKPRQALLVLAAAGLFGVADCCVRSAEADGAPCGIAPGTWTIDQDYCQRIKGGGKNLGGQDSYMTFGKDGKWAQWESLCQIRNPVLSGDICALQMACSVEGSISVTQLRFQMVDSNTIAFEDNSGAFNARYVFCTPTPYSPYFDIQ